MGTRWSRLRHEQWAARHPPVERSEQKRLAQARYRKAHAEHLRLARRIAHILARQKRWQGDVDEAANLIRGLVGEDYCRALGRELIKRAKRG
jgi:hypothetical protein